ncbi:triacylglycerol lipase [Arthrobacter sp.]|uniref:esterase/lipase family protein n=1 Tax=Arthrobacter sp. TaxID=1667 RepID=UPI0026DF8ACD|nr:alpha/beta fold hydrolase [Arthrobacter sp.]MDO5752706.1 alpha/beta fold hydrolase [Arthrobacter sp.]
MLLAYALAVVGIAAVGLVAAAPASAADDCSKHSGTIPKSMTGRPVVWVHGWLGGASSSAAAVAMLQKFLGTGFVVLAFDYEAQHSTWPVGNSISACLADYITQAAGSYSAGGGKGGVIGAAHSMGGIALRSAAASLETAGKPELLSGIVTLGTPHQGSPWGGTMAATLLDELARYGKAYLNGFSLIAAGTDAVKCLAAEREPGCKQPGYLPKDTMIATVGSQIVIQKMLFDIPFVKNEETADFSLFGDTIVPSSSSNGYAGSVDGTVTGKLMGTYTRQCNESSSYLNSLAVAQAVKSGLGGIIVEELKTLASIGVDTIALDGLATGKASISQFPLMLQGMQSHCFHNSLPTNGPSQVQVANFILAMDATLPHGEGLPTHGQRTWLYEVPSSGAADSGLEVSRRLGPEGTEYTNSTSQTASCNTESVAQNYTLGGKYVGFHAVVGQRFGAPSDLEVEYTLASGSGELTRFILVGSESRALDLNIASLDTLSVTARVVSGTCDGIPETFGTLSALGDAYVEEPAAVATGQGASDGTTAGDHGWPVWRHDEYPGLSIWFGAAAVSGHNNIGLPRWVSCYEKVCIIGNDTMVGVVVRGDSGFKMAWEFSADIDAKTKLQELNASEDELFGFLSQ